MHPMLRRSRDEWQNIQDFTERYNRDGKPFVWPATGQSILNKLERYSYFRDSTLGWRLKKWLPLPKRRREKGTVTFSYSKRSAR